MPLKDSLDNLRKAVLGTNTAKTDARLDQALKDITSYRSQSGRRGYLDLVQTIISKTANGTNTVKFDGSSMLSQSSTTPAALGQGSRLLRYKTYEAIVSNINYCYRGLDVLTDNILSPDDITKVSLEIRPKALNEEVVEEQTESRRVKEVVKETGLESKLPYIIKNTLKLGDWFVEIADTKTALSSRAILTEVKKFFSKENDQIDEILVKSKFEKEDGKKQDLNFKIKIDYSSYDDFLQESEREDEEVNIIREVEESKKTEEDTASKSILKNTHLLFHEPKTVVKLQSDLFPVCFGYLIFPRNLVIGGLSIEKQAVDNICASIIRSLQQNIPGMSGVKDDKELKDILTSMLSATDLTKGLTLRYVPPEKMQHFLRPTTKYFPYGESIFDSCQFAAKVLIAMETALAIHRLNRSTEKRKVAVEIGLPRDARKMIENLKEAFRKRKISLDAFGTVDTIPSMVTTFEDIYIPQKDGKPFVDVNTFTEGNVDVRGKVEELKFLRDSLVASFGIPASFLNIEENLSNKSALSEENILFARTIVSHQKYLTTQIQELIEKIINLLDPDSALTILDKVQINLPPPKSLQYERQAKYLGDLATMIENLERLGVPKEWSKKKFLTDMNWDEIGKYGVDQKLDKELGTQKPGEEETTGFGGGYGGGVSF